MTKSELFKAAHVLAKRVIQRGDDYRATFGACLRSLIASSTGSKKDALLAVGGKLVECNEYSRVYFDDVKALLPIARIGQGGIIPNRIADEMIGGGKLWFDLKSDEFAHDLVDPRAATFAVKTISELTGLVF